MKNTLKTLLIFSVITLPIAAYASYDEHGEKKKQDHEAHQCMQGENCLTHDGMKHSGKDGSHKQQMDKVHDHKEGMHSGGHAHEGNNNHKQYKDKH